MGERGLLRLFFPEKRAQQFILIILLFLFFLLSLSFFFFFSQTWDCISPRFAVLWKRPGKITSTTTGLPGGLLACSPALGLPSRCSGELPERFLISGAQKLGDSMGMPILPFMHLAAGTS